MIKTILFAADLGVYTPYLLQHVNDLALQHGGSIVVVHAVEPAEHTAVAVLERDLSQAQQDERAAEHRESVVRTIKGRIVDLLEEEFMDGFDGLSRVIDVRVQFGNPISVILDEARNVQADLIVVGSHGQRSAGPDIHLLGAVSSKVLQRSRVPVYMVPMMRQLPIPDLSYTAPSQPGRF